MAGGADERALPRERFIRALRHDPVGRVPLLYRMKREAKKKVACVFGITNAETGLKLVPGLYHPAVK